MTSAMRAGPIAIEALQWTFADRLRKIRRDVLGVDQSDFAQRLGVTRQAYAAWESGRNEPRSILAVARKLELMSGVPAAWVLGVDSPQPRGGGVMGVDMAPYPPPSGRGAPRFALVKGGRDSYGGVAAGYGSCAEATPPAHDQYLASANVDDGLVPSSAGGVNNADAA